MSHGHLLLICHGCIRDQGGNSSHCTGTICRCPADGRPFIPHALSGECPAGKFEGGASPSPMSPGTALNSRPQLWAEIHALGADLTTARAKLAQIESRLPCGECRDHWAQLKAADPPDFSSTLAAQRWAWRVHNAVNVRLGKPIFPWPG